MERIYLDYAASTPVHPEVRKAMLPYLDSRFGNAGALHTFGQDAMAALDAARETVARILGAKFHEVVFTGSATEANNLVLRGVVKGYGAKGLPRIVTTAIEHESVLETVRDLGRGEAEVIYLPVSRDGVVDIKAFKAALNSSTVFVSVVYASNVIGTIQPIREIAKAIEDFRESHSPYPLFHTDAAQAAQFLEVGVGRLGVDFMTLSGHKIYGPKGSGALYVGENTLPYLAPVITGGGQEFGLRAGTENVPAVVGFGKALEIVSENKESEAARISDLRNRLWENLKKARPELELNGPPPGPLRLPNNLNIYFPGHKVDELMVKFDLAGLAVSAGSACSMRANRSSYVLEAIGFGKERASASLRLTLGRPTTASQVDNAVSRILKLLRK